jgi:hypothetical protein
MKYMITQNIEDPWNEIIKNKLNFVAVDNSINYEVSTADGSQFALSYSEFDMFKEKYEKLSWFKTNIINDQKPELTKNDNFIVTNYPRHFKNPYIFGCFAIRKEKGFITTKRGKINKNNEYTYVKEVDFLKLEINSLDKATLNAPLLAKIFNDNPKIKYIIHGHSQLGAKLHDQYEFPGTLEETFLSQKIKKNNILNLPYHGYIATFETFKECQNFLVYSKNSELNWNSYQMEFPDRYIKPSRLDDILKNMDFSMLKNALDIGGGITGTLALKGKINTDILDPFVSKPDWINNTVIFETNSKYDLIVARGSFNYLTTQNIKKINSLINDNGIFIFNTFKNKPIANTKQINSQIGIGTETVTMDTGLVNHTLEYKNKIINHFFYYHSLDDIKKLLHTFDICAEEYGTNSIILTCRKKRA